LLVAKKQRFRPTATAIRDDRVALNRRDAALAAQLRELLDGLP
jgi:hypothetical protein